MSCGDPNRNRIDLSILYLDLVHGLLKIHSLMLSIAAVAARRAWHGATLDVPCGGSRPLTVSVDADVRRGNASRSREEVNTGDPK